MIVFGPIFGLKKDFKKLRPELQKQVYELHRGLPLHLLTSGEFFVFTLFSALLVMFSKAIENLLLFATSLLLYLLLLLLLLVAYVDEFDTENRLAYQKRQAEKKKQAKIAKKGKKESDTLQKWRSD